MRCDATGDAILQALAQMQSMMSQYPLGFGQWLQALSYTLAKPKEIAIVGDPDSADTEALLGVVRDGYRPFQVIALGSPDGGTAADGVGSIATVPLLQERGLVDGQATAYVCQAFACQALVTKPAKLQAQSAPR
jgi:uncharacterized protein YyaL (SSP411 family)